MWVVAPFIQKRACSGFCPVSPLWLYILSLLSFWSNTWCWTLALLVHSTAPPYYCTTILLLYHYNTIPPYYYCTTILLLHHHTTTVPYNHTCWSKHSKWGIVTLIPAPIVLYNSPCALTLEEELEEEKNRCMCWVPPQSYTTIYKYTCHQPGVIERIFSPPAWTTVLFQGLTWNCPPLTLLIN